MQIQTLLGQYQQTSANPSLQNVARPQGTEQLNQLSSSIRDLGAGNVFEGSVTSVKDGQVTIALTNGESLSARLDGTVSLLEGQSMFFQVKNNDGQTIAIRPYMVEGNQANPTLMNALKAANLPVNGKNLSMVNQMMEEQMPIDKNSLQQMARMISMNPNTDVKTLVLMQKLEIPTTPENISQFQNYMDDKQAITKTMDSFMDELPKVMSSDTMAPEEMKQMAKEMVSILTEGIDTPSNPTEAQAQAVRMQGHTLSDVMSKKQLTEFTDKLNQLFEGKLEFSKDMPVAKALTELTQQLEQNTNLSKEQLSQLFSGKEFTEMLKNVMEQQWLVTPRELGKNHKIGKLYEKMESQLQKMEQVLKSSGQDSEEIKSLAQDIRNNISFMDKINENYTYLQIPLKMSGQNASGELYVYSNKKGGGTGENEDLTAFLHLDMDHLGPTDVSIRLHNKDVSTKFYFEDDATYDLVEAHIGELQERIQKKGYHCEVELYNEGNTVNFVEDFLKKDEKTAGQVRRYSFDMRA